MKKLVALVALAALAGTASAGTIIVTFDPLVSFIGVGDTGTVDVVADIPATDPVLGWGLDLDIVTPAVAELIGISIPAPWTQVFGIDGDGFGGVTFPTGIWGDDITLATLTFRGLTVGTTDIHVSATEGDLTEGFAVDPTGFAQFVAPCGVIVTPEPASILLALAGLLLIRRR